MDQLLWCLVTHNTLIHYHLAENINKNNLFDGVSDAIEILSMSPIWVKSKQDSFYAFITNL